MDAAQAMYSDTWIYELENKETVADIAFWRRLVQQYAASRVLELACGTGRITIPLARDLAGAGSISGLDISAEMLHTAEEKLARESETVRKAARFVRGDMTNFCTQLAAGGPYDLIFVPYNSMAHILNLDDQLAVFCNAVACLAPSGHFVVDVFSPNYAQLAVSKSPAPLLLDLDLEHPSAGISRLLRYISRTYDPDLQQERITFVYEEYRSDGSTTKRVASFASHTYFPRELEILLRTAGLTITERWGSYVGEPFTDTSPLMIFSTQAM